MSVVRVSELLERALLLLQSEEEKALHDNRSSYLGKKIEKPEDAIPLLEEMTHLKQEVFRVILLDNQHHVIVVRTIYIGTATSANVRVAEVFREAVRLNAIAIIVAHNHPSGDPTPSPADVEVTRNIVQAGRLLDIRVLDHIIIGLGRWVSLREMELGIHWP